MHDQGEGPGQSRFMPPNLAWRVVLPRLALLNELLVFVGAVSMHATGVLGSKVGGDPGLIYQAVWMQCIGLSALLVMAPSALWAVRRAWRRMPDAERHYERHGAYPGLACPDRLALLLATLIGVLVAAAAACGLMTLCRPWLSQFGPAPSPPFELAIFNITYGAFAVYAFEFLRDRAIWSRHREERARQLGAQAQLGLLRSQLEPHMLFNTLANVQDLIDEDPILAKTMLQRLNAFLRATLHGSRAIQHSLLDEFNLIGDYLSLMQIRMGERLKVELKLPPELATLPVPAMLLQPLVENAIQHGLAPRRAGGFLQVHASRSGRWLSLHVRNTGARPSEATRGQGLGLRLITERLHILYGAQASMALQHLPEDDTTLATLTLPCLDAPVRAPT